MNSIKAIETDIESDGWCVYGNKLDGDYTTYMFNSDTGDVFTKDGKTKVGRFDQDITCETPYIYMTNCQYIRVSPESEEILKKSKIAIECYTKYLENETDDV